MLCIGEFYKRDFKSENRKEAYLRACEFVAKNILSNKSKVEVDRVTWRICRVPDEDLPTFRLSIFYTFDDKEFSKNTCDACKEFHRSFFVNQEYNCDSCKKAGYIANVNSKLTIGTEYYKKILDAELSSY